MVVTYLSILWNGRAEEGVVFLTIEDLVDKVASFEGLELLLVRWAPVIVFSYCLISSAILNVSSVHGRRNRSRLAARLLGCGQYKKKRSTARYSRQRVITTIRGVQVILRKLGLEMAP